jgi:hypothetical protein
VVAEIHTPLTKSDVLGEWLSTFFDGQKHLCDAYHRPMVIKSDCAKGLCAAIMMSLAFDGRELVTRITYNNLIMIVLGYAESVCWDEAMMMDMVSLVLTIIPTFHHLCRPHVIKAVRLYVNSSDRDESVRAMKEHYEALLLTLFRHATCTITYCESIVQMALLVRIFRKPRIVARTPLLRLHVAGGQTAIVQPHLESVGNSVSQFVQSQVARLHSTFAQQFESIKASGNMDSINRMNYEGVHVLNSIISDADAANLNTTASYCSTRNGSVLVVETKICLGFYPSLPDETATPTFQDMDQPRRARFGIYPVRSLVPAAVVDDLSDSNETLVDNPMYSTQMAKYLTDEWCNILPSLSTGLPRMCRVALEAEVPNSNQLSEAKFAHQNRDKLRVMSSLDAGLYCLEWWDCDKKACKLWMNNAEKIRMVIDGTNKRKTNKNKKKRKSAKQPMTDLDREMIVNEEIIKWGKRRPWQEELRLKLLKTFDADPDLFGHNNNSRREVLNKMFKVQR